MGSEVERNQDEPLASTAAHFTDAVESDPTAWEQVEAGRYMPRRIRGSYRGRALG